MLVLVGGYGAARGWQAAKAAVDGKNALLRAERDLSNHRVDSARRNLIAARSAFGRARSGLNGLGPVGPILRVTPLVRVQVRGAEALADAGLLLSKAGIDLTDSADKLLHPADTSKKVSAALEDLRALQPSLQSGITTLDAAVGRIASLDGDRLFGPLAQARDDLVNRLPSFQAKAVSAQQGLAATIAVLGGSGPRHYLLFSQNPDEVRPTGGYLGTYGILSAGDGKVALDRYENIANWTSTHPDALVPPDQAPSPFPFIDPPFPQSLANANTVPDWPQSSAAAMDIWQRGGEGPVDGAIAVTPSFLARILAVVGPTAVPSYGETVTAANVIDRFEFHTKLVEAGGETNVQRKEFIVELAQQVLGRLLDAPSSKWEPLSRAIGQALDARDAMAWFSDPAVNPVMASHGWDGALPQATGDFLDPAEFAFRTKNGRALRRTYDHVVELHSDGSARISTIVTVVNPEAPGPNNVGTSDYVRVYGPEGATLSPDSDEPAAFEEPPIAGHPAAGWFIAVPPNGETTLKVIWDVPHAVERQKDGSWKYSLRWVRINDHTGDVLHLSFSLPKGWKWRDKPPPTAIPLQKDIKQSWTLAGPSG